MTTVKIIDPVKWLNLTEAMKVSETDENKKVKFFHEVLMKG